MGFIWEIFWRVGLIRSNERIATRMSRLSFQEWVSSLGHDGSLICQYGEEWVELFFFNLFENVNFEKPLRHPNWYVKLKYKSGTKGEKST